MHCNTCVHCRVLWEDGEGELNMAERSASLPALDLGTTTDLDKWLIFSNLDKAFVSKLRLACVFGSSGNEALMVTQDDDVYALGSNSSGCLGLGDTHRSLEPRRGALLLRGGGGFAQKPRCGG